LDAEEDFVLDSFMWRMIHDVSCQGWAFLRSSMMLVVPGEVQRRYVTRLQTRYSSFYSTASLLSILRLYFVQLTSYFKHFVFHPIRIDFFMFVSDVMMLFQASGRFGREIQTDLVIGSTSGKQFWGNLSCCKESVRP